MENGNLTRRSLLKTAALATTALAVPFAHGAFAASAFARRCRPDAVQPIDIGITPQRRGVIVGGVLIICRRLWAAPRGLVAQVRGVFQACEIAHAQRHAVELYIFDGIANRADVNRMASAAKYQTLPRGVGACSECERRAFRSKCSSGFSHRRVTRAGCCRVSSFLLGRLDGAQAVIFDHRFPGHRLDKQITHRPHECISPVW